MRGQGNQTEQTAHPLLHSRRGKGFNISSKLKEKHAKNLEILCEYAETRKSSEEEKRMLINVFYKQNKLKIGLDCLIEEYYNLYEGTKHEAQTMFLSEQLKSIEIANKYLAESKQTADMTIEKFFTQINPETKKELLNRIIISEKTLKEQIKQEIFFDEKANHPEYISEQIFLNYFEWYKLTSKEKQNKAQNLLKEKEQDLIDDCNKKIAKTLFINATFLKQNQRSNLELITNYINNKKNLLEQENNTQYEINYNKLENEIIEQLINNPEENLQHCIEQAVQKTVTELV